MKKNIKKKRHITAVWHNSGGESNLKVHENCLIILIWRDLVRYCSKPRVIFSRSFLEFFL